jgi:hypothetical protein
MLSTENTSVYIDESGETGRRSSHIVFAVISTDADRALEKIVKKLWKAKPQYHPGGELHAVSADDATIRRMLLTLSEADVSVYYSVIEKRVLKESAEIAYYRELARIVRQFKKAKIIIADKKDTNNKREKMIDALGDDRVLDIVFFEESHKVKQLQAVDFVAWAIGRYYETGDGEFMKLLGDIIQI